MNVFNSYAAYYDLFYSDKDYAAESSFVLARLQQHSPALKNILELGCGTGIHAVHFARAGFSVAGYDLSERMLAFAKQRQSLAEPETENRLSFHYGDVRDLQIHQTFDAAVSLFHVMSYQTTDHDLMSTLSSTRRHLKPGSPFLFDFWHGPAVVSAGPSARRKIVENAEYSIERQGEPVWDRPAQTVQVNYHISVQQKSTRATTDFDESHLLRYFFVSDLEPRLKTCGFRVVQCAQWLTDDPATSSDFSAYIIAVAE